MDVEYRKKMCGGEKHVEMVVAEDILPSIGRGKFLASSWILLDFIFLL